jgi:hypothetical protein
MLANQLGLEVSGSGNTNLTVDAFGRQRTSAPLTLFDAFTRYRDNGKFWQSTVTGGSTAIGSDNASIDMTVDGTSGASVVRESTRVFAYQPGKSLQIFNTFVMNEGATNLRQRVGYFGVNDGIFLEQDGTETYFVIRSNGSDTRVAQSAWNIDKANGVGQSKFNLDVTKAQILWFDVEWLGVGSVRCGFVYNGVFVHCHTFHHANSVTGPYMTTACLPIRFEIENTGVSTAATLKQICSSVISEGGYQLRGSGHTVSTPIGDGAVLPTVVNTGFTPLMSLRLKSDRKDAISVLENASFVATAAGLYDVQIVKGASLTGASWQSSDADTNIEYDISATAYTGGTEVFGQIIALSNQAGVTQSLSSGLFDYQFERDGDSAQAYTIIAKGTPNSASVAVTMNWDDIT